MTARVWTGKTKREHSDLYQKLIEERDIPNYRKTEGFVKLSFLVRHDQESTYFKLITYWEDLQVVKNFTGQEFERAVAYPEDEQYLLDFPGSVLHYEVFAE